MRRRLFGWLVVRISWWLTTHPGFYSPCDDDHCHEVRAKARAWGRGTPTGDRKHATDGI